MFSVLPVQRLLGSPTCRVLLLLLPLESLACSHVRVTTSDGVDVIARTVELGGSAGELGAAAGVPPDNAPDYRVRVHPRGETWKGSLCKGATHFDNKRGFVSVDAPLPGLIGHLGFHEIVSDGMNEDGLTMSILTLRQSVYQDEGNEASVLAATRICFFDLVPWALGQFQRVDELVHALSNVSVIAALAVPFYRLPIGDRLHWAVDDAYGGHVVLEYLEGKLQVHQNKVGVMTNDPDYTWHLRNLNNYAAISGSDPQVNGIAVNTSEVGNVPSVMGHGLNLFGLPGDLSPASRFVRLFFLKSLAEHNRGAPNTLTEGIQIASGVLNSVWITKGTVALNGGDRPGQFEFTQYSAIKIPRKRQYLWRNYGNSQWRSIDLTRLSFDETLSTKVFDGEDGILDATDRLLPSEDRGEASKTSLQV